MPHVGEYSFMRCIYFVNSTLSCESLIYDNNIFINNLTFLLFYTNIVIMDSQRLERNLAANEAYVKINFPGENFISDTAQFQAANRYSKGLIIPKNVRVAESRIPISPDQRNVLRKELRQAEILARLGNSVYIIPEHIGYKIKPKDAVVNGELFEFKTVTGNARTLEWEFRKAKKKGDDVNVFISIESDISRNETEHRVKLVLDRHPEFTGKIVVSWRGGKPHFWDTSNFR